MRKLNQRLHFFRVLPVLLTIFFLQTMLIVQAQQRQISGTVTDGKGSPVASATVAVKGGKASTLTADNGSFTISAKDGDVLVFTDKVDTPNGELVISFRYELEDSGRRLRATERLRGGGREQDNVWVFDRGTP